MSYNKYILKAGKVLKADKFEVMDIAVEAGKIIEIGSNINLESFEVIDCQNKIITPGFLDVHVHFRDPGFTHKEDIITGSKSAIKGGYTTVFTMPNTKPCMDNVSDIEDYLNKIRDNALCNVVPYSAITKNLEGQEIVDIENISKLTIAGFTDDGRGVQEDNVMKQALKRINNMGKIVSIHSEDETEIKSKEACINDGEASQKYGLFGINNKSEYNMLKRDIDLLIEIGGKYNLCHASTKESVELIEYAQSKGLDITCEVSPHHLVLAEDDIKEDENNLLNTNYKMNPPLRTSEDRDKLVYGLNKGIINIIATDHAPHSKEEKDKHISKAPFGIVGLEQSYAVLNTYLISNNKVEEETILRALTYNPANRFEVDKEIAVGKIADFAILDPMEEVVFSEENTYSKSSNSPFMNLPLKGKVFGTILEDKVYIWD